MENLLMVTAISEVKSDKNGRAYKTITVTQAPKFTKLPNGKTVAIKSKLKSTALNAYELNYLEQEDLLWDSKIGDYVEGSIVTRNVTEYQIGDRTVDTASVAVFAPKDDTFEKEVEKAFYNAAYTGKDSAPRFELISNDHIEVDLDTIVAEMVSE